MKSYVAFLQPPDIEDRGVLQQVYENAWASVDRLTHGSFDTVTYTEGAYAYQIQQTEPLDQGAIPEPRDVTAGDSSSNDTLAFAGAGEPAFVGMSSPGQPQNGSFSIGSNTNFTPASNFVFGSASENGSSIPSPIKASAGLPDEQYTITPIVKFYVADSADASSPVCDVDAAPPAYAAIDFTGRPETTATVIQEANGAYTVVYE
ncbi:hypothetical protein CSW62_07630 [Caulobacter sp. FWC2]|nr:hypothetical protein CSW62_07630 [Caulobacter sp. FWC2]